jgi:hypothetical protein
MGLRNVGFPSNTFAMNSPMTKATAITATRMKAIPGY